MSIEFRNIYKNKKTGTYDQHLQNTFSIWFKMRSLRAISA